VASIDSVPSTNRTQLNVRPDNQKRTTTAEGIRDSRQANSSPSPGQIRCQK
jgi:hypothetical protein